MVSQRPAKPTRDAAGRFVATKHRTARRRRPAPNRLMRIAERMRARLEERLAADDESLFAGRDNGVSLLLRLTEVMERLAVVERPGEVSVPLHADDRAILDRYVAWRFRAHGLDARVAGVPPPAGDEAQGDAPRGEPPLQQAAEEPA